jgi:hypothetical protein
VVIQAVMNAVLFVTTNNKFKIPATINDIVIAHVKYSLVRALFSGLFILISPFDFFEFTVIDTISQILYNTHGFDTIVDSSLSYPA